MRVVSSQPPSSRYRPSLVVCVTHHLYRPSYQHKSASICSFCFAHDRRFSSAPSPAHLNDPHHLCLLSHPSLGVVSMVPSLRVFSVMHSSKRDFFLARPRIAARALKSSLSLHSFELSPPNHDAPFPSRPCRDAPESSRQGTSLPFSFLPYAVVRVSSVLSHRPILPLLLLDCCSGFNEM